MSEEYAITEAVRGSGNEAAAAAQQQGRTGQTDRSGSPDHNRSRRGRSVNRRNQIFLHEIRVKQIVIGQRVKAALEKLSVQKPKGFKTHGKFFF